jgi:general secretion pathway protein E/type IV pilus assembly protein PilB
MIMATQIRIGDILKEKGLVNDAQIRFALQVQKVTGEKLGQTLTRIGLVSEFDLAHCVSEQLELEHIDLEKIQPDLTVLKRFNRNTCLNQRIFPIREENGRLVVATSDLPDQRLEQTVLRTVGMRPVFVLSEESKVVSAIYNYFYFLDNPIEQLIQREIDILSSDASLTIDPDNFITLLLLLAIKNRTSDVHIKPMPQGINIAFRIDGVLNSILFLPPNLQRIVTAIKLAAGMDISEQRLPQDGRWSLTLLERKYDIRASSIVTPYGENMVLRLLSQERANFSMEGLGFLPEDVDKIRNVFDEPYGIVLLTGPTGSGKSTTLVAGLTSLDLLSKNVLTVENPIEYLVPLARQTQVNLAAGYDFSRAMPSFLRHDPDIILIGEMRDEKTARTALTAATTGHLVLSTLHSNTSLGALPRLRGLGMDNLTIAESLLAVISQRLVRTICPHCRETYRPDKNELEYLGVETKELLRGKGCDFCNNTGYFGRTLIYEALFINKDFRIALEQEKEMFELQKIALDSGFRPMAEIGVQKVLAGDTTVAELQRVLGAYKYIR